MTLTNKTKSKTLSNRFEICDTHASKARGLMFSRSSRVDDNSLIFIFDRPAKQGLHMFFVFYPIDVLFLDEDKKIVETATLDPFTIYNPKERAKYVVEMKKGLISRTKTSVGDSIDWRINDDAD